MILIGIAFILGIFLYFTSKEEIESVTYIPIKKDKRASIRYIMISGKVENNNDINDFPLSLDEKYIDYNKYMI